MRRTDNGIIKTRKRLLIALLSIIFLFTLLLVRLVFIGSMIFRLVRAAQNAADRFGCYLCGGIAFLIGIQVLINIAVVTGSIPPTGIPLPFISSGSSSLIVFCGGIGIAQSVNLRAHASVRALY